MELHGIVWELLGLDWIVPLHLFPLVFGTCHQFLSVIRPVITTVTLGNGETVTMGLAAK
jgi:hypothetical protein